MPNWINGSLKVRGEKENVKRFFAEGLNVYKTVVVEPGLRDKKGCLISAKTESVPIPKEEWMHVDTYDDGSISIDFFGENDRWAYVENTRRAFVCCDHNDIWIQKYNNDQWIGVAEVNQAWGFDSEDWLNIAKAYNVDIRLWGLEGGMQFAQVIEILNGEIIADKEVSYDSWTMPLPWIGG